MNEKHGDPWPDEPADENISTDPPNSFDRDETDYEPGLTPPNQGENDDRAGKKDRT